jgi:hypothetical protein
MKENPNFQQITQEMISLFISHELNINMIYFILAQNLCCYSQAMNKNADQIKEDIEIIFNSLPPPIEELDDDANQQSNCS